MRALFTVVAACTLLAAPAVGQESARRPLDASPAYAECEGRASSMASSHTCLRDELARVRWALRQAGEAGWSDPESDDLWRRSVDYDCAREADLAGGGNSAGDRETACQIERTTERLAYVRRFGNW